MAILKRTEILSRLMCSDEKKELNYEGIGAETWECRSLGFASIMDIMAVNVQRSSQK